MGDKREEQPEFEKPTRDFSGSRGKRGRSGNRGSLEKPRGTAAGSQNTSTVSRRSVSVKSLKSGGGARTPGKSGGSRNGRTGKKELGQGGTFFFFPLLDT